MTSKILQGLGVFTASAMASTFGYHIRNNFTNNYVKELGAVFEVGGHLISYAFYADAFKDSVAHAIDGEIIAILNFKILHTEPVFIPIPNNPITGEILLDDIEATPIVGEYFKAAKEHIGGFKYLAPYIIGKLMLNIKDTPIFKAWGKIANISHELPASHTIGLLSYSIFNLSNLPKIGDSLDQSSNYLFSHINDWAQNPGGDTKVGEIYRDYVLAGWEAIHRPYHFFEEIKALDAYSNGGGSILLGEWKHFS